MRVSSLSRHLLQIAAVLRDQARGTKCEREGGEGGLQLVGVHFAPLKDKRRTGAAQLDTATQKLPFASSSKTCQAPLLVEFHLWPVSVLPIRLAVPRFQISGKVQHQKVSQMLNDIPLDVPF
ncbi:hypothetical protein Y032_0217g2389 [Ancylostoma ceylanicum]|uniref:Uncharacterized protein n=1 Tax=Ancylostoma ceylanicum TaxID=53326 RepID=A0A016SJ27_9BILA|nr:hypothetical protein Y032_0217g2389 [Ancylostoma ceylanicum]